MYFLLPDQQSLPDHLRDPAVLLLTPNNLAGRLVREKVRYSAWNNCVLIAKLSSYYSAIHRSKTAVMRRSEKPHAKDDDLTQATLTYADLDFAEFETARWVARLRHHRSINGHTATSPSS